MTTSQSPIRPPQIHPPMGVWRQTFVSLENRDFRHLWLGMLLMVAAMQMQMIVRGYLVFDITSSPALLALVNGGFALPLLCLALFGGAISDRLERKRIVQLGQAASALTALFVGVAITTNTVTWVHLFGVSIFQGALFAFMMPARQAIIPQLVGKDRLTNAMALNAMGMSAISLLAPAAGGILYAAMGPDGVYYLTCGMGFMSLLPTALLPKLTGGDVTSKSPIIKDIGDGLSYMRNSPLVLVLLLISLAMALLAMPFPMLLPVFVVDIYHRGPEAMGLLVSFMGAGSLVGSFIIAALGNKWKPGLLVVGACFLTGTVLLLVALVPIYSVALGFMVLLGLGFSGHRTLSHALIMQLTEDQYQGRVMSVFMMSFALMPLGVIPAGIAAEFVGGQWAVGALAAVLLVTVIAILATQKGIRDMG